MFSKLDPSTWKVSLCKYYFDNYSDKSTFLTQVSCDGTCEKFRIQRYSRFWDLDINLFIQLHTLAQGLRRQVSSNTESMYGYSYAFLENQINRLKLISFQKVIFIGGADVVNQLYNYKSTVIIIKIFSWTGVNPIEFSSQSNFTISVSYANGASWFRTMAALILIFSLLV